MINGDTVVIPLSVFLCDIDCSLSLAACMESGAIDCLCVSVETKIDPFLFIRHSLNLLSVF